MTATPTVCQEFLNQAEFLCRYCEFLPGGPPALAEKLQDAAQTQTPLKIKLGLDPTRPDLHLGHSVVLRKLRTFQELGHQVILLIGDATAMIGDPSGRNETRPPLTNAEVVQNAETYLAQAGKLLNIDKLTIVRNHDWFSKMAMEDWLALMSKITVAQMLVREDFANRYKENRPISLHEFMYPLMQAYDSVVIDADIELGGTDQRFNTLLGRDIQTAYGNNNPQSVLLMPLIEGTDGKIKMSKSYPEHCVNLTDAPNEMYGKLMSIPDALITRYIRLLTTCSPEMVENLERQMQNGNANPRDVKSEMAKWVIGEYYSRDDADNAEQAFIKQFKNHEIPTDIPEIALQAGVHYHLPTVIADNTMAPSKSEARRLIKGDGVKLDQKKIMDQDHEFSGQPGQEMILQVGRRRYAKLVFG